MRITKKQQHINGLNYDLDYFKKDVAKGIFPVWHFGDRLTRFRVMSEIAELESELQKIASDKNYKPWKD